MGNNGFPWLILFKGKESGGTLYLQQADEQCAA